MNVNTLSEKWRISYEYKQVKFRAKNPKFLRLKKNDNEEVRMKTGYILKAREKLSQKNIIIYHLCKYNKIMS